MINEKIFMSNISSFYSFDQLQAIRGSTDKDVTILSVSNRFGNSFKSIHMFLY